MIFGVGIDIIETYRIQKSVKNQNFVKKVFHPEEVVICEKSSNAVQKYSARFAAKEAFMKALGTGWSKGIKFSEIVITNDENGKPIINTFGKTKDMLDEIGINKIHVSLSHIKDYANAMVILEK